MPLPVSLQIERNKFKIYEAYMYVPMSVAKRLLHQAQVRLQNMLEHSGTGERNDLDCDVNGETTNNLELEGFGHRTTTSELTDTEVTTVFVSLSRS